MKLSNLKFWSHDTSADRSIGSPPMVSEAVAPSTTNVIKLPVNGETDNLAGLLPQAGKASGGSAGMGPTKALPAGPMAAPELTQFFANNFFGLGRHNGSNYRTQEALDQGKALVVSKFQNAASVVIDQIQAKADRLRNMELQTEGICGTTTAQLVKACERYDRDIGVLQAQIELAAKHQGWVLSSLNEYQIGFGKGLREAVDAELLGL